jgi:exopolysaccharide biosynthesis protein
MQINSYVHLCYSMNFIYQKLTDQKSNKLFLSVNTLLEFLFSFTIKTIINFIHFTTKKRTMICNLINSKPINVLSNVYLYDRIKDICGNIKTNKKKDFTNQLLPYQ